MELTTASKPYLRPLYHYRTFFYVDPGDYYNKAELIVDVDSLFDWSSTNNYSYLAENLLRSNQLSDTLFQMDVDTVLFEGNLVGLCNCDLESIYGTRDDMFYFRDYEHIFQWKRLKSIAQTTDGVTKTTSLYYEVDPGYDHGNVVAAELVNSNGDTTRTVINYAYETGDLTLQDRNMTGIPISSNVVVNGDTIGGTRLTFHDFGFGIYSPKRFEERLSNGTYRLVSEIDTVNSKGRTTLSHTRDGIYSTVLWNNTDELPLAKVINNKKGIAGAYYTSFEETGGEFLEEARTGTKVHNGSFTLSGSLLDAGEYVKSYWVYNNSQWAYHEEVITHNGTNDIDFTISGKLDEVRIFPTNAQMQTNNFDPVQLRVVSQSDVNSTTTSYGYDDLGRLMTIKDKDRNIVQFNKYHYIE
jgi:YD repeat-containing protein